MQHFLRPLADRLGLPKDPTLHRFPNFYTKNYVTTVDNPSLENTTSSGSLETLTTKPESKLQDFYCQCRNMADVPGKLKPNTRGVLQGRGIDELDS